MNFVPPPHDVGGGSSPDDDGHRGVRALTLQNPIERLKNHLIALGAWSEERHAQAEAEIQATISTEQKKAEAIGTLHQGQHPSKADMFEDVYAEMPPHLLKQRHEAGF